MDSIGHWEIGYSQPRAYLIPRIIDFLGYAPWMAPATFGEWLVMARRANGFSRKRLAKRARIDESTLAKWERGHTLPLPASVERLRRFFKTIGQPMPEFKREAFYSSERRSRAARNWRRVARGEPQG